MDRCLCLRLGESGRCRGASDGSLLLLLLLLLLERTSAGRCLVSAKLGEETGWHVEG